MAVDVSNLVNMLATQPGQNVATLGATLLGAQEAVRKREADAQKLAIESRKLKLEEDLAKQKLTLGDIELKGKQGEVASSLAQSMLTTKDPMVKQQLLATSAPLLKATGATDEQLQAMAQNINSPDMWKAIQVNSVAATDFWKATTSTATDKTQAAKKKEELIANGVNPRDAEGIAYGTYKAITDPNTGDQKIVDMRDMSKPVPQDVQDVVKGMLPSDEEYGRAKIISKGNKQELRLQKDVKDLSEAMIKTGAPKVERNLELVESIIRDTYGKGGDLPGYGATALAPDWAVSEQAQNLRQASIKLFNIELAERSGAAVTMQELERLKDEFKTGAWRTDRQFVEGVNQYRKVLEDYKKSVLAGYGDDVKDTYWKQGGITLKQQEEKPKSPAGPTEEQIRADGEQYGWSEEQIQNAIKTYVRK